MRAPSYLVLDIETVADPGLFTPPPPPVSGTGQGAGYDRNAFPPLHACQPIVLGVLWLAEDLSPLRLGLIGAGKDEPAMLADFARFMEGHRPVLVTWNGRGFDLPVLRLRSLRQGLSWPWYYDGEKEYRHRYTEEGHLDVGSILADHGAARMTSLDGAARLIGLPGKDGMDGSQVESLYQQGQIQSVQRYCLRDVVQTAFVFLRCRLLQGALDVAGYRRAAETLLAAVAADPRVAPLAEKADRSRLLLLPGPPAAGADPGNAG